MYLHTYMHTYLDRFNLWSELSESRTSPHEVMPNERREIREGLIGIISDRNKYIDAIHIHTYMHKCNNPKRKIQDRI